MATRFGYIPVASELLSEESLNRLIADYIPALKDSGGERWQTENLSHPVPLFFLVVSGGTEQAILDLRARRITMAPHEPAFLLAHPGNNSLPASLEVLARLQQDGEIGRIFYLKGPDDKIGLQQIETAARDVEVHMALQQARIGLVGTPSDWLVASSPDPDTVQKRWGPKVVPIHLNELYQAMQDVPQEAIAPLRESLVSRAVEIKHPSPAELEGGIRVYWAMKQLLEQYNLSTITLRCFDLIGRLKITGCFALAQLNDEGIIAGCEGDLVSTVGMLWAYTLLDQISWMANPAQIDEENNTLWLGHCTVPRSMVQEYRLRSHFESGLGMGIQGKLSTGPVTLLRIGGKAMDQLWLAEGEILQAGHAENLCRTQVEVRLTRGGQVTDLLHTPLGNHLVLVPGYHADRLRTWWQTTAFGVG